MQHFQPKTENGNLANKITYFENRNTDLHIMFVRRQLNSKLFD